jgi:hypothetical protein
MNTRNCPKFKGELGNYSTKEKNILDPSFDDAFRAFNIKPQQNRYKISCISIGRELKLLHNMVLLWYHPSP